MNPHGGLFEIEEQLGAGDVKNLAELIDVVALVQFVLHKLFVVSGYVDLSSYNFLKNSSSRSDPVPVKPDQATERSVVKKPLPSC